MFNIHYAANGEIVSYQEGNKAHKGIDITPGCKCLSLEAVPSGFFDQNFSVTMKVANGKLVQKNTKNTSDRGRKI